MPPSGAREGVISRVYGCFSIRRVLIGGELYIKKSPLIGGLLEKNAHKEGFL
jgi:hypothetical protein